MSLLPTLTKVLIYMINFKELEKMNGINTIDFN